MQSLWKIVCEFSQKVKDELPHDPVIPILGIYPDKTLIPKDTCTPMLIAALFTIAMNVNNLNVHWQMKK